MNPIAYFKSHRALRKAKDAYRLAVLQSLIDENRRELARLADLKECRYCLGIEDSEQRAECAS